MRVRLGTAGGRPPPVPSGGPPGRPRGTRTFTAVLGERAATPVAPAPPAPAPAPSSPPERPAAGPLRTLMEQAIGSERQVDTLLAAAARGKTFSPSELLALQTSVFRYSQAVEVVSRATDKLVGAVKQTLGTQV